MDSKPPPAVLTIAGSDSGGGAGIQVTIFRVILAQARAYLTSASYVYQADLKAFTAFGCYGTSVITALTAQNTQGVQGVHPTPPEFLEQQVSVRLRMREKKETTEDPVRQLTSVLDDIEIRGMKTGMLYDAEHTRRIARTLRAHYGDVSKVPPLVVDPVAVSTSGHVLLHEDAVSVMIEELFPLATLITPNKPEAELLLSRMGASVKIETLEDMIVASEKLLAFGSKAVLVKGGHVSLTMADVHRISAAHPEVTIVPESFLDENMEILQVNEEDLASRQLVVDVLREGEKVTLFVSPRIDSSSTHGTGCTLSAVIASALAKGESGSSSRFV